MSELGHVDDIIRKAVKETLAAQNGEQEIEIDRIVTRAIASILASFGIDDDDRLEIRADFAHLRRWRKSVEQIERASWKAVVTALVTGLAGMIWLGVQTKFGK